MDNSDRQKRIIDRLRIQPTHHGQLDISLITLPESSNKSIAPERWQLLKDSLDQQGSNLIPLVVRRTDAYEEAEYEVVYGVDWYLVAKELDVERLWVWVFDLTDEQASLAKKEIEQLVGFSGTISFPPDEVKQIESLLNRLENSLIKKLNNQISEHSQLFEDIVRKQIEPLQNKLEGLTIALAYSNMTVKELREIAKERKIPKYSAMKKAQLIESLVKASLNIA